MEIKTAEHRDLKDILKLQYLAYQSEAQLLGNWQIPPLCQTIEEKEEEFRNSKILKLVDDEGRIFGSVSGSATNGTLYIGKLMVHPSIAGQGYGKLLLNTIQERIPHNRAELFTSTQSVRNIRMYEKNGFLKYREEAVNEKLTFVYLEKKG